MALTLAPPDAALLARTAPFTRLLAEACDTLGLRLEMDAQYGFVGRLTTRDGKRVSVFGKSLGLNPDSAAHLAADKDYTAHWLAADGLPTPPGQLAFSPTYRTRMALKNADTARRLPGPDAALAFAENHGFPVVVKPNSGSEGRDIHVCDTAQQLATCLAGALAIDDILRIEPRLPGRDYRVLVLNGRVVLAYERRPLSVTGDGHSPLATLIDAALKALETSHRGAKIASNDPRLGQRLASDGLTPTSILPAGHTQPLLDNANLSTGGHLIDITVQLPPEAASLATQAAVSLGLSLAGVDILAPDLLVGIEHATILEVNSAPGIDYYATATAENWPRARAIVTEILRSRIATP